MDGDKTSMLIKLIETIKNRDDRFEKISEGLREIHKGYDDFIKLMRETDASKKDAKKEKDRTAHILIGTKLTKIERLESELKRYQTHIIIAIFAFMALGLIVGATIAVVFKHVWL